MIDEKRVDIHYLGVDTQRNTAIAQYYLTWLQDLEICSSDIVLCEEYKDKIQLGFSHLYHLYNQDNAQSSYRAGIVEIYMQHLGIPILAKEKLRQQELGWQDDIRNRVNTPMITL